MEAVNKKQEEILWGVGFGRKPQKASGQGCR